MKKDSEKGYLKLIILGFVGLIVICLALYFVYSRNKSDENEIVIKIATDGVKGVETDRIPDIVRNDPDKTFFVNGEEKQLSDDEWIEFLKVFNELKEAEPAMPKVRGDRENYINFTIAGDTHEIAGMSIRDSSYISVDSKVEYVFTDEFSDFFEKNYSRKQNSSDTTIPDTMASASPVAQLVGLSVQCEEPTCNDEYLEVARKIVGKWLDSLKDEDGEYSLKSYKFTDDLTDNRVFHGDGFVNGGREFVCFVAFDAPEDESTVFYASGTYDTFYHYYYGAGVLARFRWENGTCTLIEYDSAYSMLTSDKIKSGLYGINSDENTYQTFYDFMNDEGNVNEWLSKDIKSYKGSTVLSHNVMMLSSGDIIFLDIDADYPEEETEDAITAAMGDNFYDYNGNARYSSPVHFIDGSGAVVMTYRKNFPIIFDDYNHDGNPDYTIRISSDEYGSTYGVSCMDLGGTPWEDGGIIYVYGEFAESIRLQVSDSGKILNLNPDANGGPKYEEERIVGDASNTCHDVVSEDGFNDYRMYSQRFYLPEHLRTYGENDTEIIFYFWNNTDEPVMVGGQYEIERKNGEDWEKILSGKLSAQQTVEAGDYAEIVVDVSGISEDEISLYRVKIKANDERVYGGFYKGSVSKVNLEVNSGEYASGSSEITFSVENTGLSVIYPDSIVLYRGSEEIYEVNVNELGGINSGDLASITISDYDFDGDFVAGEYTLKVIEGDSEFSGSATVKEVPPERRFYFPTKVNAQETDDGVKISLKNNIWNETNARISYISEICVMQDGMWYSTPYDFSDAIEVEFGKMADVELVDCSYMLEEIRVYFEDCQNGEYDEWIDDIEKMQLQEMTFEEFLKSELEVSTPKQGDLCRINICIDDGIYEYVYFEMP